jgi:hypothetical protein
VSDDSVGGAVTVEERAGSSLLLIVVVLGQGNSRGEDPPTDPTTWSVRLWLGNVGPRTALAVVVVHSNLPADT